MAVAHDARENCEDRCQLIDGCCNQALHSRPVGGMGFLFCFRFLRQERYLGGYLLSFFHSTDDDQAFARDQ